VLLRNLTQEIWDVEAPGEEPKQVKPNQRLLVRPMRIKLAGKQASVVLAGGQAR
jgi:hypothetical protein